MKIVYFEQNYYDELLSFSKRVWPEKSEEYLKYRLFKIPEKIEDNRNNLLVINDEGKVVGCILYFPTRAIINGKEEKIFWGHDFYVDEQYRGAASLRLMLEMANIKPSFGAGATDLNLKIQKELKAKYIGVQYHYLIFNIWSFMGILYKLKLVSSPHLDRYYYPDLLEIGNNRFKRTTSVDEVKIPNNGYWCASKVDIDFIRDGHFLKNRFFENFNKYQFYLLEHNDSSDNDECYFVIRPTIESGFPVLSIVDFRYNMDKPEQLMLILKAAVKIGVRNRASLISLRASIDLKKLNLNPLMYKTGSRQNIGGPLFGDAKPRLLVTPADSDTDFLAG
jgi:hypothetical protein